MWAWPDISPLATTSFLQDLPAITSSILRNTKSPCLIIIKPPILCNLYLPSLTNFLNPSPHMVSHPWDKLLLTVSYPLPLPFWLVPATFLPWQSWHPCPP